MAVRAPQSLAKVVDEKTGMSMVEAEIMAETASSLGHHGRKLEAALEKLRQEPDKDRKLTAARAAWEYFIQRELCGMRDHRLVIREMGIPQEVLNLMGAAGAGTPSRG